MNGILLRLKTHTEVKICLNLDLSPWYCRTVMKKKETPRTILKQDDCLKINKKATEGHRTLDYNMESVV